MDKFISSYNKEFMKSLAEKRETEVKSANATDKEKAEYLKALADDTELQKAYGEGLVGNVNVTVEADMLFTDFMKRGTIKTDERSWYYTLEEPLTDNEARVYEISNHGQPPREAIVMERDVVRITPFWVTSPEVSMHKFNLRQGDITNEEKMRKRASKGLAWDLEADAQALVESALFDDISQIAGIEIDRRVKTYPSTNKLDLTAQGALNLETLKAIFKHFAQLGKMVESLYIPIDNLTDFWDFSSITSDNVTPESLIEQIVKNGTIQNVFGYPVNLVPVNTLNGNSANGAVYIWAKTRQPVGEYRIFPNLGFPYTHEDARRVYYQINRAQAMFITPPQRLNVARIQLA